MVKAPIQREKANSNTRKLYVGNKPLLRVSDAKKASGNFSHTKDVMDYYIQSSYFQDSSGTKNNNYRDIYTLYNVYNNIFDESYFNYVTNPLNTTKTQHRNFPSKIRPYNILRANADLLFGEFDKRPKNYTVWVGDAEAINSMEGALYKVILSTLEQQFVNKLNDSEEVDTGVDSQPVEPPVKVKSKFLSNYKDERAIWGQANLQEIDHANNVNEQLATMFKDYVIAGESYSFKTVEKETMIYERVSPMDLDYDKSPDVKYIEDASWVVRRKWITASDAVTMFYDELKPEEIDQLDAQDGSLPFSSSYFNSIFGGNTRHEEDLKRSKLPLFHCTFKYYKKLGVLSYQDEFGMGQLTEVDENYKPSADEHVEWLWVPVWWEGYRLDVPDVSHEMLNSTADHLYFRMREIPAQRNQDLDFAYCKGPYNGIRFSDTHSKNVSIIELGLPYQVLYIILHYRLELAIAKSRGKIAVFDINSVPNGKGWDEEKWFYWSEANGYAMVDRNQMGVDKSWTGYAVLDLDLFQHIANLIKIMDYVRQEWDQLVGFTPQRKGQTQASETASGIDAARYQSSVISERLFSTFDNFIRTERQGLLDLSKFTNLSGRKAVFHGDDMQSIMLSIDPARYTSTVFNVHVSNSSADLENLQLMKQQAANFASQGARPSVIAEVLQANNISKLKSILKEMEEQELERAQQMQAGEEQVEIKKLEIQKEYEAIKFEFQNMLQEAKYDREEALEHIKGQYALADTNTPGDSADSMSIEEQALLSAELREKMKVENGKLQLELKGQEDEKQMHREKLAIEKYKADTQYKVAKENRTASEIKAKQAAKKSSTGKSSKKSKPKK
jgi:hypothetical protein